MKKLWFMEAIGPETCGDGCYTGKNMLYGQEKSY